MQPMLPFDIAPLLPRVRRTLRNVLGSLRPEARMAPIDQLVKSQISGRTYDEVSWPAYLRLHAAFPSWESLLDAEPRVVEGVIADVTYADAKAEWVVAALRRIVEWQGELTLDFLTEGPVEAAFRKLQNLTGVGPKVASAVLNFSTLARPILVVDTHVCRVSRRLGLVDDDDLGHAHRRMMEQAGPTWDADDLFELHWLMKRFGQSICRHAAPLCQSCPLADLCPSARTVH